ncbi:hypothetical protein J4405_00335 [Candidatus Woesearchaeota archaeon]|nr:hypothetical protein [Candidatus Woesearchaeota archaeon]
MRANQNPFLETKPGQGFVRLVGTELLRFPERNAYGLVGVFGSREPNHDLDLIFYPSGDRPVGEYLIAHIEFLKRIKEVLRLQDSDLIPFSMLEVQDEVEYLSRRTPKDIFLHNLVFTDFTHITERVPFLGDVINSRLFETIHGSADSLKKGYGTSQDFYFFTLVNALVVLSNYPSKLLTKKQRHILGYVAEHTRGKFPLPRSNATVDENIATLQGALRHLDSL